ncbi:bifunctional diaminohydroxyphosphoribosylaminopyrimidine deaminase/5-amino-6-(5-phosphoribosylamino)uracil reductase RibD [Aquella oligotrophica]|uniref:Riboflavin biosynthesis protein RibD n=1 Tax=Aquella oligotrophica TaxID=2067065 RepID=A0A2I7N6Y2_9NEIS|nr:bifunctional diaminohydroxyphosphoribosylaminopyrimidine deaminase/5-amino-6-(5-phosphoribosylamino)uracil reductase RibD [Aquella oligotrophica]AUR52227.1 riboflavin biosynthesis protein RibD [Aquella oligotrophica]
MQDQIYMQLVLEIAKNTMLQTLPNPHVAAIVVKDGVILGIGCHLRPGDHHAEIYAIQQAGAAAKGATLYVNLEPCSHYGKTPPCANAIIAAGISRVVIANLDENPLVAGKGVAKLKEAGILVDIGILAEEAYRLNQVFFHNVKHVQPFVTIKVGMSLDGKIASYKNLSQWITSRSSRKDAHQYRINHTGILVGVGTVLSDDPSLTPHLIENAPRNPIRIVLDSNLKTPLSARVIADKLAPTIICTTVSDKIKLELYQYAGVDIIVLENLEINTVLNELYKRGIYSILVEGGEKIYASFIESGKVNQIISYISPQLIGSRDAKHFFAGNGFADLMTNMKLKLETISQLENDVKLIYTKAL